MSRNILLLCSVALMPCQKWLQQPTNVWRDFNIALGPTKAFPDPTFVSGNFELFPYIIPEYFYALPYSFLCISVDNYTCGRFQWPRGLKRGSATARLLRLWFRIPPGTWISVCCECCVLSGRGLCKGLTTRTEESYRLCCVVECYLETS
jgi:hypothetical protein